MQVSSRLSGASDPAPASARRPPSQLSDRDVCGSGWGWVACPHSGVHLATAAAAGAGAKRGRGRPPPHSLGRLPALGAEPRWPQRGSRRRCRAWSFLAGCGYPERPSPPPGFQRRWPSLAGRTRGFAQWAERRRPGMEPAALRYAALAGCARRRGPRGAALARSPRLQLPLVPSD